MELIEYPNETIRAISDFLFVETPISELGQCDLIIVLGNDQIDGTMKEVKKLLDVGVINNSSKIILSGATGSLNHGKEKECIRLFRTGVEKYSIPPELMILEPEATNTYQNLEYTKRMIETDSDTFPLKCNLNCYERILFIGKAFMMRRVEMTARRLGYPMDKLAYYGTVDREGKNIGKDCWWQSEAAIIRVFGELERIGKYAAGGDLRIF